MEKAGLNNTKYKRKPEWLKIKLPTTFNFTRVDKVLKTYGLHTICVSGKCPNLGECWDAGTATIMILGDICTRACKFCAVKTGKPLPPDYEEPRRVAEAIHELGLHHVVLTSVDRDDLYDKGSGLWALTIKTIKQFNPWVTIEALIPDFDAVPEFLDKVIQAKPEIISHNLETVRRLTPILRSRATYDRSLQVLKYIAGSGITAKSGIMVGLGETTSEVLQTMDDLLAVGVKIITIGQYLQPTPKHYPVKEYIKPEIFEYYRRVGLEKGFEYVESGPLVRSSYHAERQVKKQRIDLRNLRPDQVDDLPNTQPLESFDLKQKLKNP